MDVSYLLSDQFNDVKNEFHRLRTEMKKIQTTMLCEYVAGGAGGEQHAAPHLPRPQAQAAAQLQGGRGRSRSVKLDIERLHWAGIGFLIQ